VLWIHRDDYAESGGHERVAGRVLENHALAEHCRETGIPERSAAGRGIVSFRMYPDGVGGLIEGWSKGFAAGAGATPGRVMAWIVVWLTGLMLAFVSLVVFPASPWAWAAYAVAALMAGVFARRVGSFPWWAAPLYPVPLVFFFGLFAWAKRVSGKVVTWKGREIHAD
jgi:4,4'-diaponeurosporenoate glycosyltransferase